MLASIVVFVFEQMPRQMSAAFFCRLNKMLSLENCKKILGDKAIDLSDEAIEEIRDELYIAANLAFSHWQKNCSSTKREEKSSLTVGEQPVSAL